MLGKLSYKPTKSNPIQRPLRAVIEIIDGELRVFPIADSDGDEQRIRDALRFGHEDFRRCAG